MTAKYEPGLRVSEFVLERLLGAGAFGEVWQARHHIWENERVAVKLPIEPQYVRYLQREGLVVHGLRHPNIVGVRGFDPYAEIPYLVFELVRGPSLREVIEQHREGLPINVVASVMQGVLSGLSFAHANQVIHRDLKPANILLDLDGTPLRSMGADRVRVTDFGFGGGQVDTLRSIAQSVSLERGDSIVGTLAYMAPELRDGGAQADPVSDLYAVGVILFELLTGERPAGAESPSTVRANVPEGYDRLFHRLYARADRRCESAQAALDEFRSLWGNGKRRKSGRTPTLPPIPPATYGAKSASRETCSACGEKAAPQDQFCTQCGEQLVLDVRRCGKCGTFPAMSDVFCIQCGERLPESAGAER